MAYLITGVDEDVVHASTHGMLTRDDLAFLRERASSIVRTGGEYVSRFLRTAKERLDRFDFNLMRDRVERLSDRSQKRWDDDVIKDLLTIQDIQNAKSMMREYIMAEPRLRSLYHKGLADGFGELYIDENPGVVGRAHKTYRDVMIGAFDDTVVDEERWITYLDALSDDGECELSCLSRNKVRRTWAEIRNLLDEGGVDPSSVLGKIL